jgi:release factor glutamine methyltransferase
MCDFVANSWGIVPREGSILDIGTGSGCIACTIAADLQNHPVEVVAWDISDTALRIASENAKRLNVNVRFEKRDVLELSRCEDSESRYEVRGTRCEDSESRCEVRGTRCEDSESRYEERWDVIVSNPPYVCEQEKGDMERHVLEHEPDLALFVPDNDPLLFYRHIGQYALKSLKPGGYLLVEINSRFGKETAALMADLGFVGVRLFPDLYEKDRFVIAYKA